MKCEKCGSEMKVIRRETTMAELDDATDGQKADYLAAEQSGDFGDWGITEVTYECKKCGDVVSYQQ